MTYKGHIENGVIVIDDAIRLEEGTEVRFEVASKPNGEKRPSIYEELKHLIGSVDSLPSDCSENLDYYLQNPPRG